MSRAPHLETIPEDGFYARANRPDLAVYGLSSNDYSRPNFQPSDLRVFTSTMLVHNLGVTTCKPRIPKAEREEAKKVKEDHLVPRAKVDTRPIIERIKAGYKTDRDFKSAKRPAAMQGTFLRDGVWFRMNKKLQEQIIVPHDEGLR